MTHLAGAARGGGGNGGGERTRDSHVVMAQVCYSSHGGAAPVARYTPWRGQGHIAVLLRKTERPLSATRGSAMPSL